MADLEGSAPGGASRTERDNCQTGVRACACVWNLQSRTNKRSKLVDMERAF